MCGREYASASTVSGVWYDLSFMRDDMADRSERSRKFIPAGFGPYAQLGLFAPDFLLNAHYHDLDEPTGVEDLVRRIGSETDQQLYSITGLGRRRCLCFGSGQGRCRYWNDGRLFWNGMRAYTGHGFLQWSDFHGR
jgi:hypothetical protein